MSAETCEALASLVLAAAARKGTQRWTEAIRQAGSAVALLEASDAGLVAAGLGPGAIVAVRSREGREWAARTYQSCAARGIHLAPYGTADYPELLRQIADPPLVLFWRGVVPPAAACPAAAIVGARKATRYGRRCARRLGAAVAGAGAWVVSGLALGIDAAAQAAAVESGGCVAVLAGGVDRCYPAANRRLAERILARGVVLSEHPPGTPTRSHHFPIRNRIITGLSLATVVVEAEQRSGSLVSARHAAEQGRDVFAVPGPIDSPVSRGTNLLIGDGCRPLLDPGDLLGALGLAATPGTEPDGAPGPDLFFAAERIGAGAVFRALDDEPASADALALATGLDESVVLEKLTALELEGLAERLPCGAYVRCARGTGARERS